MTQASSYLRLKREIHELMVKPSAQSLRFAELLTAKPAVHTFKCKEGSCNIDSAALDGIIRVNVTNESIGNLNSRGGILVESGLVPKGINLAPTMSLSSLDLILQLISVPNAILHYFARRKPFEETADYVADELDLVSLYLDNGFNIGEHEIDGTPLMVYGHSNHLDTELTLSRDRKLGKQLSRAATDFWNRLLISLEDSAADGWVTAAVRLRNVGIEDQRLLEKPIRRAVYHYNKNGPAMGYAVYGPKSRSQALIYLVCGQEFEKDNVERDMRTLYKTVTAAGIADPLLILIKPPNAAVVKRALVVRTEDEAANAITGN